MANTKDFGRAFVQFVSLNDGTPFIHTATSQAIEPPFPHARVVIVRVPFTHTGVVLGWWQSSGFNEEEALLAAMEARGLDLYDVDLDDDKVRDTVRRKIAENTDSWDEEWEILSAFGLTD